MKVFLLAFALLFSCYAGSNETSPSSHIKRLISYSQYGNGDVYVQLESSGTICSYGYFINENSPGFKNNFSMLLAAYQAGTPVRIEAYDDRRWSGSSGVVCEIYSVIYSQ